MCAGYGEEMDGWCERAINTLYCVGQTDRQIIVKIFRNKRLKITGLGDRCSRTILTSFELSYRFIDRCRVSFHFSIFFSTSSENQGRVAGCQKKNKKRGVEGATLHWPA